MELDLAAIYVEAFLFESVGDVARGYRSEKLVMLARAALEAHRQPVELLRELFGSSFLLGRAAHGRRLHLIDCRLVAFAGLDGSFLWQKEIAAVPFRNLHYVTTCSKLGNIFFQDNFHV